MAPYRRRRSRQEGLAWSVAVWGVLVWLAVLIYWWTD